MRLFRLVKLPSDKPVQYVGSVVEYVGTYAIPWSCMDEPTVGFVEVDDPNEPVFPSFDGVKRGYTDPNPCQRMPAIESTI